MQMQHRAFDSVSDARLFASDLVLSGYRQAAQGEEVGPGTFRAKKAGAIVTVYYAPRESAIASGNGSRRPNDKMKILREARDSYAQEASRLKLRLAHLEREIGRLDAFFAESDGAGVVQR